jgi:hypothetical protein
MLYVEHGRKNGFAVDDWLLAESEILGSPVANDIEILPQDIERTQGEYEKEAPDADSVYRIVSWVLTNRWGHIAEMVDALTVLLVTWNRSFYGPRGLFDQTALKRWLNSHLEVLTFLRNRQIATLSHADESVMTDLFDTLLVVTEVASGRHRGAKSPVSVAKSLHLLAPDFLPPWDGAMADGYGCPYAKNPSEAYLRFCYAIRFKAGKLASKLPLSDKPLLKRIDEYNFVTFTVPRLQNDRGKATKTKEAIKKSDASGQPRSAR